MISVGRSYRAAALSVVIALACGESPKGGAASAAGSSAGYEPAAGGAGESASAGGGGGSEPNGGRAAEAGSESGEGGASGVGLADAGAGAAGAPEASCNFELDVSVSPVIGTVGIVEWTVDLPEILGARIEFGLDKSYGMLAPVDLAAPRHRTLLMGMKADRAYHFRIVASGRSATCASADQVLTTGPLRTGLPHLTVSELGDGPREGRFLISCFLQEGPAFIVDQDGDYVFWYGSGQIGRAALGHDGKSLYYSGINVAGGDASMRRVSLDGLVDEDLSAEFGDIHHDFTVLPDGTIGFIQREQSRDRLVERAPDGSTRVVVDIADAHGGTTNNHANSIHYWPSEDAYTVSDLAQDAFVKVARDGTVLWVLGGETSDFGGEGAVWDRQHGHQLLGPEGLLFFNNGPFDGDSSSAVELSLDLSTMTAERVWEYAPGDSSVIFGDVQRLENGNTLVVFSGSGLIHEVDPEKRLVREWLWDLGGAVGYTTSVPSLYPLQQ
jgi:hypothetical protein